MKQKLTELKGEIPTLLIIVGNYNDFFSIIDRTVSQKTNKNIEDLNNFLHQLHLIDICRIVHPWTAEHI